MHGFEATAVRAALDDWRTAPIEPRLRVVLGFLDKLTTNPDQVTSSDVRPLLDAGIAKDALREAVYVCFLFCTLNRLADSLGFGEPTPDEVALIGKLAWRFGYGIAQIPG